MPDSTFYARIEGLRKKVGSGLLVGRVDVNQVYARYQDSGIGPPQNPHIPASDFHHPRGGRAGYLSQSFEDNAEEYVDRIAMAVLGPEPLFRAMEEDMTDLAGIVYRDAPREFWILRNSANARVIDDGNLVYLKPAAIPRLDQATLNAIRKFAGGDVWVGSLGQWQHHSWYAGGGLSQSLRQQGDIAQELWKLRRYGRR